MGYHAPRPPSRPRRPSSIRSQTGKSSFVFLAFVLVSRRRLPQSSRGPRFASIRPSPEEIFELRAIGRGRKSQIYVILSSPFAGSLPRSASLRHPLFCGCHRTRLPPRRSGRSVRFPRGKIVVRPAFVYPARQNLARLRRCEEPLFETIEVHISDGVKVLSTSADSSEPSVRTSTAGGRRRRRNRFDVNFVLSKIVIF